MKGKKFPACSFIETTLQKLKLREGFKAADFKVDTFQNTLADFRRQASKADEQGPEFPQLLQVPRCVIVYLRLCLRLCV